jgi:hypothetical protein
MDNTNTTDTGEEVSIEKNKDPDRPRGILSPTDRRYLLMSEEEREEEYTQQGRSRRRKAIEERLQEGYKDFTILLDELSPKEVAEFLPGGIRGGEGGELYQGEIDALALFIASLYDREVAAPDAMLNNLVESALGRALDARGEELEDYDELRYNEQAELQELQQRFYTGQALSIREYRRLQAEGVTTDLSNVAEVRNRAAGRVKIGDVPATEYFQDDENASGDE